MIIEISALRKLLLSHSIDAHYVLDLHCDDVALPHVFYGVHKQTTGKALAKAMGFSICLEEDVTGTVAFDGTHTQPCFAATLELRGNADVSPEPAEQDCLGILDFLTHEKLIHRKTKPKQPVALNQLGVDQVRMVKATMSGIVTYRAKLGTSLTANEAFADLILLDSSTAKSIPILVPCDDYLFSATGHYFITKGETIAMLATHEQQIKAGTQLAF